MRKIFLFMMVSLDGFFEGENHDLSWHHVDAEFEKFAEDQMQEMGTILFGKTTYEMMASFWPSEQARKSDPGTAGPMNVTPKIVFSKSLKSVEETEYWKNVTLLHDIDSEEIKRLKEQPGNPTSLKLRGAGDIAILGSNNVLVQLTEMGLVDEFRIMVNPVVVGKGTLLFQGIKEKVNLKLLKTRKFGNGNILLTYIPEQKK